MEVAKSSSITLIYYGRDADDNRLDLYDASTSYVGLARTLAVLGHYYLKKEIIAQAPRSAMSLYVVPPEEGSFKQNIIAGAIGGIIAAPFGPFAQRVIDSWIPAPNTEMHQVIELLREANDLARRDKGLPVTATKKEVEQSVEIATCLDQNAKDLQTVRSITSNSFKAIFRPIGRSANQVGIISGSSGAPRAIVDSATLALIEADAVDDWDTILLGVMSSFSRGSKTGIIFSADYNLGFRIEYTAKGRLAREDDFSWSQYSGQPVRLFGRFVRFFDGNVKKFLVFQIERVTLQKDVEDYFNNQREILIP